MEREFDSSIWYKKYSPKDLDDLIIPDRIKKQIDVENDEIVNYIFSGSAGVGKTTFARLISKRLNRDVLYINAAKAGIDTLRNEITEFVSGLSWDGNKKVVILDEFDRATDKLQDACKVDMDEFSVVANFICITNHYHKIIEPLRSRLTHIKFDYTEGEKKELAPLFFKRCLKILNDESITHDVKVVAKIVKRLFPDMRLTLNELQRISKEGEIKEWDGGENDAKKFFTMIKDKDFDGIKDMMANMSNYVNFHSSLYDVYDKYIVRGDTPRFMILMGDCGVNLSLASDQRVQLHRLAMALIDEEIRLI